MTCDGDTAEICGGPNRLSFYEYSATGKRGLAYNNNNPTANAVYANLFAGYSKITWGYDWGFPSWGLNSSFELYVSLLAPLQLLQFIVASKSIPKSSVPMLWGLPSGTDSDWTAAVETTGTKNILGFNEPDLTYSGSSNMLPQAAADGFETYLEPFSDIVKVGTPNVLWNNLGSSSGGDYDSAQWTEYFLGNCTSCHFNFACIHYYADCDPSNGNGAAWFEGNVTNAYSFFKLPIWITEFQCYGTDAQQVAFLQEVLPWLDSQSYVARYAYFGVFEGYLVNANGNGLSDIGEAYATT